MPGMESLQNQLQSNTAKGYLMPMLINGSKVAEHIASATPESKSILIDAFGGAGGNTIAFAKSGRWKRVYAIEKDPAVLACAKHNAQVYGVDHMISWYEGDCFEVIQKDLAGMAEFAVVFGSPPWGGRCYNAPSRLASVDYGQVLVTGLMTSSIFLRCNRTTYRL